MESQTLPHKGQGCCGHAGSQAEHDFATATEALKGDHRVIEQVLNALEKMARAPELGALDQWEKAIDFIRNFADKCHHLKEEKLLFPAMEQHGVPLEGGPLGVMLAEHEEGRGYVKAMAAALAIAAKEPAAAKKTLQEMARAYVRFLREHIQKEDDILFNMADDLLSAEEHELKEIGAGVHEKYLAIAQELTASR